MFTAVVLDETSSRLLLAYLAHEHKEAWGASKLFAHHCTLAMGAWTSPALVNGEEVFLRATHFGTVPGRVCAVKVEGVTRKDGKTPHVTLATFGNGKPKESNDITQWEPLARTLHLRGFVELCE